MANLSNFDSHAGFLTDLIIMGTPPEASFMRSFYRLLHSYYLSNGVYDVLATELRSVGISDQNVRPLRNPAYRVVEFYASKLWGPGELEIVPDDNANAGIVAPIERVWEWSNFSSTRQRMARWFATFGDLFVKVTVKRNGGEEPIAVYHQLIAPQHVTEFDTDERGHVTYIRLDIPIDDDMHTETWSKDAQEWRTYRHDQGFDLELDRLAGYVTARGSIEEATGEDFVPFVYQPFRDDGAGRGNGAFTAVLDKIDEANRQATRLSQMLFRHNKPLWAGMANMVDSAGRPMPFPDMSGVLNSDDEYEMDDNSIIRLSGLARLEPLVPNINYSAALEVLMSHMAEIENDLPELAYYNIRDMNQVSGRAVLLMLDDAIGRALEARHNAEQALQRANAMALTIGQNLGIFEQALGTFEQGAFKHTFGEREILPIDAIEELQRVQYANTAGLLSRETVLRKLNIVQDATAELQKAEQEREARQAETERVLELETAVSQNGGGE